MDTKSSINRFKLLSKYSICVELLTMGIEIC